MKAHKRPKASRRDKIAHQFALALFDAARALTRAKGAHGRFYAHNELKKLVELIEKGGVRELLP